MIGITQTLAPSPELNAQWQLNSAGRTYSGEVTYAWCENITVVGDQRYWQCSQPHLSRPLSGVAVHPGPDFSIYNTLRRISKMKLKEADLIKRYKKKNRKIKGNFAYFYWSSHFLDITGQWWATWPSHVSCCPWSVSLLLANWDHSSDWVRRDAFGGNLYQVMGRCLK